MKEEFKCPKPETGVFCFDCPYREVCPFLNPPKPKPRVYPPPEQPAFQPFQPLPIQTPHRKDQGLPKHLYRTLLLVAEDFQLTKPELRDLVFYASRFYPFAPSGGRGKSWRRVYAVTCLQILYRDKRQSVYENNKQHYISRYKFDSPDFPEICAWVKKEIERINKKIGVWC